LLAQNINIHSGLCLRNRETPVECNVCLNYCPTSAVNINGNIEINRDICLRCGVCVGKCLTEVFSYGDAENYNDLTFLYSQLAHERNGLPFLPCKRDGGDYSFLPNCLAMFNETDLILTALEIKKDIRLYMGGCAECSESRQLIIEKGIHSANKILFLLNVPWKIYTVDHGLGLNLSYALEKYEEKEKKKKYLQRRGFFNQLKIQTINAAAAMISGNRNEGIEESASRPCPDREKWIPPKRKKLLSELKKIKPSSMEKKVEGADLPFYKLEISDKCVFCNICQDSCPTGALKKYEEGFECGLEFEILKCIHCMDCEKLCPKQAIQKLKYINEGDLKVDSIVRMARKKLMECVVCEMTFLPIDNDQKCPRCLKIAEITESLFKFEINKPNFFEKGGVN